MVEERDIAAEMAALAVARAWEEETHDLLAHISPSLGAKFRNDEGFPTDLGRDRDAYAPFGAGETHKMVRRRLIRLQELSDDLGRDRAARFPLGSGDGASRGSELVRQRPERGAF